MEWPGAGPLEAADSNRDGRSIDRGGLVDLDARVQGAELRGGERRELPIGGDLPGELAITPDDPELGLRPAEPPGIEATTSPRMEATDETDGELRVRVEPAGMWR